MCNFIKDIKLILINKKILGIVTTIMIMVCALVCTHHSIEKKENDSKLIIGIINEENNSYADLLIDFFKTNETFKNLATVVVGEKEHIESEFYASNINAYIVIPSGFVESLMYLEPIGISVYLDSANETEAIILKSLLQSYERYVLSVQYNSSGLYDICKESGMNRSLNHKQNVNVSWNLIKKALSKESFFEYNEVETYSVSLVEHYLYVLLFVIVVYMGIYAGVIVKREQYSGVLGLYKVCGGSKFSYILSKAVCIAGLVTMFMVIPLIIGKLIANINVSLKGILVIFILSVIINIVMISCSMIIKSIYVYTLVFNVMALLIVIIGGGIIPIAYSPDNMAIVARYLPYDVFENAIKNYIYF